MERVNASSFICLKQFLLVCLEVLRPSQQFFSHVVTEPLLPGYLPVLLGSKESCSMTQHGRGRF